MKYEKPEVAALGTALESIHNTTKGSGTREQSPPKELTTGAYQADE